MGIAGIGYAWEVNFKELFISLTICWAVQYGIDIIKNIYRGKRASNFFFFIGKDLSYAEETVEINLVN